MRINSISNNTNKNCKEQQSKEEQIVTYIMEYQQQYLNNKLVYQLRRKNEEFEQNSLIINKMILEENTIETNIIQNLVQIFENFYNRDNSQILLQNSCLHPDKIRVFIQKAIQIFNLNQQQNNKSDNLKVTYIGITKEYDIKQYGFQQIDQNFLQNFSIMIQDESQNKIKIDKDLKQLIQQDQYYLKINFTNKITNDIQLLYRYFLKNKIKKFQPKIIFLLIEINNDFDFEAYFFQKLISQLEKISQNSLIVIPFLTSFTPYNYEKYLKSTLLISNSYFDYRFKNKNKAHYQCEDISADKYKEYSKYFVQTQKEEQFFFRQYLALKVRQNQFKNPNLEIELEQQKQIQSNQINQNQADDFYYNRLGILNFNNQIELVQLYEKDTKQPIRISQVEHFISYNTDRTSFIICIVNNNKLFYKQCKFNKEKEKQIEDQIYLDQYPYFQVISQKQKSSYFLQGIYFYQFNVQFSNGLSNQNQTKKQKQKGSGFKYYVQIYKYDVDSIREPEFYSENNQYYYDSLINFTISPLNENYFILLGGTYQSLLNQSDYEFNLGSYAITVKIDQIIKNKLQIIETIINDSSLLYFEAQTKYQATSLQSQIQRLSIFGYEQSVKLEKCQILNQDYFDFYQKKKKLFKSNQLNTKIIEQSLKKLDFFVIVQELVYENVKIVDQEGSINLKELSKQLQLQVHKFRFIYDLSKQILDIQVESSYFILEKVEKQNSLRDACLFVNWLEDKNNQYIFHYNGIQNLYLLYFNDKPKSKIRQFIFEDPLDQEDNLDFDEVILNDLDNEQLWIVRKVHHQDHISLDLFESDWINLQDVKDSVEDSITKVPMNLIYRIGQIKEDFCLIGLEVKWQQEQGQEQEQEQGQGQGQGQRCPYLILCTSTIIYEISIKQIRKIKWDNILRYKLNSWEKEPLKFQESPIHRSRQVQFQVNMQIPTIVASLESGDLLLFYSYCNVKKFNIKNMNQKQNYNKRNNYQIELEEDNIEFQYKTINYDSKAEVNIAKVNTLIIQTNQFEFSVIVEESDGRLYTVFSGDFSSDNKQYLTVIKESKILSDAAFLKNQSLIISQIQEKFYHLK